MSETTAASPQISDSIASPEVNTPATCHGWVPSRTSLPGVRPANWRAAPRPTISSRRPGVNLRPSMIFTCGRTAQACSLTPRSCTLPSSSAVPPRTGRLAATTISSETIASPLALRAMPGACAICTTLSRSSTDITSDAEAPRMTIAVSVPPVFFSVSL